MLRATYHKRTVAEGGYGDLEVTWLENGELIDLSAETITMKVFPFGGDVAFTKTTGITGQAPVDDEVPDPNVIVDWVDDDNQELNTLDPGEYVMQFLAGDHEMMASLFIRENAPNYGYCEIEDVLIHFGDLQLEADVNLYSYINAAADEMNAELGQKYEMPLDLSNAASFVEPLLRKWNAQLAAGRYMLAHYAGDMAMQPYGRMLVETVLADILKAVDLTGVPVSEGSTGRSGGPVVQNYDEVSAVTAFESNFMRTDKTWQTWRPGTA